MSRYNADDIYAKKAGDDDDWETDGDYVNNLSEQEQRKAGTADRLVVQTANKQQVGIAAVRQQALAKEDAANKAEVKTYYGSTQRTGDGQTVHNLDRVKDESKGPQSGSAQMQFTGTVSAPKGAFLKKVAKGGQSQQQAPPPVKAAPKQAPVAAEKQAPPPAAAQAEKKPGAAAPGAVKAPGPVKGPAKAGGAAKAEGGAPAKAATKAVGAVKAAGPSPAELEKKKREEQEAAERKRAEEESKKREAEEKKRADEAARRKAAEEEAARAAAAAAAAAEEEEAYPAEEEEAYPAAEEEHYEEEAYAEEEAYPEEEAAEEEAYYEEEGAEEEEAAWETCTAIGDWAGEGESDLRFSTGDTVWITDRSDAEGWWYGQDSNGVEGSFPSTYVKLDQ